MLINIESLINLERARSRVSFLYYLNNPARYTYINACSGEIEGVTKSLRNLDIPRRDSRKCSTLNTLLPSMIKKWKI